METLAELTVHEEPRKIRLGIIGCGAIAEDRHIPAALGAETVELVALSDTNVSRARAIARQFGLRAKVVSDYQCILNLVDAVVISVPNALHANVGIDCLSRGIHVLCEKPLALTTDECRALCEAARQTSSVLAVGFVTRFFSSTELLVELLHSGYLGALRTFDYEFGSVGGWAPLSGYNLSRSSCGGGVLVVNGSHFLDRMTFLFDTVSVLSYEDDSRGGIEANCRATFRVTLSGRSVEGSLKLSKTHALKNRLRMVFDYGNLEIGEGAADPVCYYPGEARLRHVISNQSPGKVGNRFVRQLEDFAHAIATGSTPKTSGEAATRSVALTEACYAIRQPIDEPWCDALLDSLGAAAGGGNKCERSAF